MDCNLGYSPVLAGNIRSRNALRPIARERKDLMDHNLGYSPILGGVYSVT